MRGLFWLAVVCVCVSIYLALGIWLFHHMPPRPLVEGLVSSAEFR